MTELSDILSVDHVGCRVDKYSGTLGHRRYVSWIQGAMTQPNYNSISFLHPNVRERRDHFYTTRNKQDKLITANTKESKWHKLGDSLNKSTDIDRILWQRINRRRYHHKDALKKSKDDLDDVTDVPEERKKETIEERRARFLLRARVSRMFRVMRMIGVWCRSMKEQSMRLVYTDPGITQLYFHNTGDTADALTLAFDKSDFSRAKGIRLPLHTRISATKLPEQRTEEDVDAIYKVLNNVKSFKDKYPENLKRQLCRVAWYMSCEKERVILRQGQQGMNFYFLYSGSAYIQLETQDPITKRYKISRMESILTSGTSFGELALLVDNGTRTVSVICREPSELFQIDKDAFRKICSSMYERELESKVQITRQFPVFASLSDPDMSRMCFQSLIMTYSIGRVIEQDWSLAKHLYIVMKGNVQLLREVDTRDISDEALHEATTSLPGNLMTKLSYWTSDAKFHGHRPPSTTPGKQHKHYMTVGTLRPGHITDVRLLSIRYGDDMEHVVMVSQGVQVLRISRQLIQGIIDKYTLDTYIKTQYIPHQMPDQDMLVVRYIKMDHWNQFRHRITDTVRRSQQGEYIAMIPERMKMFNHLKVIY